MKTVLVTGSLGFIASNLCEQLLSEEFHVVGIDNFLTGRIENIESFKDRPNFSFVRGDVNNFETLSRLFYCFQPTYVFHYAACVGVKRTLDNPRLVLDDIKGIENILQLSRDYNVRRIFYSSSSEVYGEPVEFPQDEQTTPLNSRLPYAVVKNVGEVFVKTFYKEYGQEYTVFRFFNTYGPKQSPDFVVSRFINQALKSEDITVYGDGAQRRTFCYVTDNVAATMNALRMPEVANEVFNIGSDVEFTIVELADLIVRLTGSRSRIVHLPALAEGDMERRRPNISRMRSALLQGRELVTLEAGLQETIEAARRRLKDGK